MRLISLQASSPLSALRRAAADFGRALARMSGADDAFASGFSTSMVPRSFGRKAHCVSLVGAGPGCADLMTLRGAQRLQQADVIFYDRLVDPDLLNLASAQAERIFVGKAPGHHSWPQARISAALVQAAQQGKRVVRLKCGDPGVFARGAEEAEALHAAGLAFEIIPGVTAASACAAHAGLFMTERGVVDTLVLTTATSQDHALAPDWQQYLHRGARIAIYMGVHVAPRIAAEIAASGLATKIEVSIVSRLGQPDGQVLQGRGSDLLTLIEAHRVQNPAIIFLTLPKTASALVASPQPMGVSG